MRLRSDLLVAAILATARERGLFAVVAKRGHEEGGVVYVKCFRGRDAGLYVESGDGWRDRADGYRAEGEIDAIIDREREFDPDLWVVEVEGEAAEAALPDLKGLS